MMIFGGFLLALIVALTLLDNLLNGTIPSFISNLTELTHLQLAYNPFSPAPLPPAIGTLTKLQVLWLQSTNLAGEIPTSIGDLTSLENLDLSRNSISGAIPTSIARCVLLYQMELFQNNLSGVLPPELANLTSLRYFDASQNRLSGNVPESFARIEFSSFNLNDNSFTGYIPASIALSSNLFELKLFNNMFTGAIPADLGFRSALENFDVSGNRLSGELPASLCYRGNLRRIVTFRNRISGQIPAVYINCASLAYIRMSDNEHSGEVPAGFFSLQQVRLLHLQNNRLTGSILRSIIGEGGSFAMTAINIAGNRISGEIPSEICWLKNLMVVDLGGNRLSGRIPACMTVELTALQRLSLEENELSGRIPSSLSSWDSLTDLNLRRNRFSGEIPPELGTLPVLTYLDLSDNSLSGKIPATLSRLQLNVFNVSNNELEGEVPAGIPAEAVAGNRRLCSPDLKRLPRCRRRGYPLHVLYLAVLASLLLVMFLCLWKFWHQLTSSCWGTPSEMVTFHPVLFRSKEILHALKEENLVGSGASGQVYRAEMTTGETVAVKRLWGGGDGLETESAFRSEVETLGRIRHSNVVRLLCSCSFPDFRVLVYEYMDRGSLGDALHNTKLDRGLLVLKDRAAALAGAALGLAYLHHDCVPAIIHRDVKPNNVLLARDLSPRLADFGLARTLPHASDHTVSQLAGSYGYMAPEYAYTMRANEKSDVYSFGVMVMEVVTGRRPNDELFEEKQGLVRWVREAALSTDEEAEGVAVDWVELVVDPRMGAHHSDYDYIEMLLHLSIQCTATAPADRPSMRRVADLLRPSPFTTPPLH